MFFDSNCCAEDREGGGKGMANQQTERKDTTRREHMQHTHTHTLRTQHRTQHFGEMKSVWFN